MPTPHDLDGTLILLRRHHSSNGPLSSRGGRPSSGAWHALWPSLAAIREASASGDAACTDWLAIHGGMIHAVEACREHDRKDALTFRPSR